MLNPFPHRRLALPLGLQQLGLIIGALIVAQLVTLALTLLIPPAPVQRWNLEAVAASLLGKAPDDSTLERREMRGPPDISAPGWLVSESSRQALARRLGRPVDQVVLAFYTQLPVGGVAVPVGGPQASAGDLPWGSLIGTAHAQAMPGGGPPPGGMPGGAFPGGGFPGGGPPGGMPGRSFPGGGGGGFPGQGPGGSSPDARSQSVQNQSVQNQSTQGAQAQSSPQSQSSAQSPGPSQGPGAGMSAAPPPTSIPMVNAAPLAMPTAPVPSMVSPQLGRPAAPPAPVVARPSDTAAAPAPIDLPTLPAASAPTETAGEPTTGAAPSTAPAVPPGTAQPIPFRQPQGLLAFTTPPFIEGDFIAAMRQPDGRWIAVAPKAEPFPNRWQRRVMLWFALSLLVVAPVAWLFARRIVKPLEGFARAAEMLGRDPAASMMPLSGPAEIGRAAHAFNQMRNRLRAFVDDRTAMVGAISHDLRTPLTRLRFRLEDVPDDQRDDLLAEVDEMELMISQVIAFIRDASTPGPRERIDLAELVESTVRNARVMGSEIELEVSGGIPVEVDPLGIRRLLGNLLENAIKYGDRARVRVWLQDEIAIAEIIDDGPGIPADERERAFEPFFRCEQARESEKPGSGLGLAVCRSIARAHGGDVQLEQRADGFVASLTLPILYDGSLPKAA